MTRLMLLHTLAAALSLALVSCATTQAPPGDPTGTADGPLFASPETFRAACEAALTKTRSLRDAAKTAPTRTEESVLEAYNQMAAALETINNHAQLVSNVHPEAELRKAGEECEREAQSLATEINLDRDLYDAVSGVPEDGLDDMAKRFRTKVLRDFRLSGVDKDDATRARLKAIQDELVQVGQEFGRTIREDVRNVEVTPEELAGLPKDFIEAHAKNENGKVTLTTNYPDYIPVQTYADSENLRKQLAIQFLDRGFPQNDKVLKRMLELRREYASLLGYANWADYKAQDKMAKNAETIRAFTEQVATIARPRMELDLKELLARKQKDHPGAKAIEVWDRFYYVGKVQNEKYGFDSLEARPYFDYTKVRQGILDLYSGLFGLTFERRTDVPVWHESVEAYDLSVDGKLMGRFYFDMHPRAGKYGHAAMFPLVTGLASGPISEAALVCNFPDPRENPKGALMEHTQVVTFFHEFGHLVHHLLATSSDWSNLSGINVEWDFVEAPSQLLEEWAWDADVLGRFAKHVESGAPIPRDMVLKMKASSDFGKGVHIMRQVFYTALSFYLHLEDPGSLDISSFTRTMQKKYSPYPFVDGTHVYAGFGHLHGYSSMYYTYQWSLTLAKDIFTKFNAAGLLDAKTAAAYRDAVLRPGATKDAADLVESFLGRPFNLDAYKAWLEAEPKPST